MSHAVELDAAGARYGSTVVLHEVAAKIPTGKVTAVTGHNGSGKSTLIGIVAGVHPLSSGTLRRYHARRPALVVQRSAVSDAMPVTVRQTVAMGRWERRGPWRRLTRNDRDIVDTCLKRLDLVELAGRRLGSLSGGQRQRALVAQGIAQQSDLLLLDEPDTGLDAFSRELIHDLLGELSAQGTTIVHATHDQALAGNADQCLVLSGGRMVPEDSPGSATA